MNRLILTGLLLSASFEPPNVFALPATNDNGLIQNHLSQDLSTQKTYAATSRKHDRDTEPSQVTDVTLDSNPYYSLSQHTDVSLEAIDSDNEKSPNGTDTDHYECAEIVNFQDKCTFVKKHCQEEHLGVFNYLEIYYCSKSWSVAVLLIISFSLWLAIMFMSIGIAASDYLCPNLNTTSKMLGLSESLAGVTFLAFGNGSPDVFSTYAAMKIGSGSLAIGELIGAASFITAVVAGSMAIIRPFKVARKSFTRDIVFFTVSVGFSIYFMSDGVITRLECVAMLSIYVSYVIFVVGWHWYNTTKRKQYLVETRARDFYTEAGHEANIEQDEEIRDEASILTQGLDYAGFNSSGFGEEEEHRPNFFRFASPRGSIIALPGSPIPLWQEHFEDEQEEAYGELTKGMRLRPQNLPSTTSSQNAAAVSAAVSAATAGTDLHIAGSHSPITPIRPSLFGALEFRNVLQQLEDSRSSHSNIIPLLRRSQENTEHDQGQGLSQSLPNTESYLAARAAADQRPLSPLSPLSPNQHENRPPIKKHLTLPTQLQRLKGQNSSTSSLPTTNSRGSSPLSSTPPITFSSESPDSSPSSSFKPMLPKLQIPQLLVSDYHSEDSATEVLSPAELNISDALSRDTSSISPSINRKHTLGISKIHSGDSSRSSTPNIIETDSADEISSNTSAAPQDLIPPSSHFSTSWFTYVVPSIPKRYAPYFSTLFPSLVGLTSKSLISIITSIATAPTILCLNVTIPVIEAETIEKEASLPTIPNSPTREHIHHEISYNMDSYFDNREPYHDDDNTENIHDHRIFEDGTSNDNLLSHNDQYGLLVPQSPKIYVPIKRWLLVLQAIFGPFFVLISNMDDNASWPSTIIYSILSCATLLIMIRMFVPDPTCAPTYIQFVSLIGFVIAISWISVVANEVVGILKAMGIMFHISDAVLGLTVFAVGNSLGDFVANTTVAKMGFPMMALSACFGGPMLNILVGIGMSGLVIMSGKSYSHIGAITPEGYHIKISHSLIISGITLLVTLLFLLITIPLNRWKMSRTIGIISVSFWVISTIINVIIEVTVFEH